GSVSSGSLPPKVAPECPSFGAASPKIGARLAPLSSVSIPVFSVRGVRVQISGSWFVALFLFTWMLATGYFPLEAPGYAVVTYWISGTISSLALFASVLFHELSHCFAATRLGVPVRQITLFIFGGASEMDQTHSSSPGTEFRIAVAGPAA